MRRSGSNSHFLASRLPGYNPGMSIVQAALAIAFAALCVWLPVRIVNRRERWTKWMLAAALGVPVLYVLSFGPVWWLASRGHLPAKGVAEVVYDPLIWAAVRSKGPIRWWADFGAIPRGRRMNEESAVIWFDLDIPYQPTGGLPVNWD